MWNVCSEGSERKAHGGFLVAPTFLLGFSPLSLPGGTQIMVAKNSSFRKDQNSRRTVSVCLSFSPFSLLERPSALTPVSIMVSKSSSFQKDQNSRRTVDFLANGLVFSEGAFWARQRKMITPAFSPASIKHAVTVMNDQARRAVQQWVHAVTHARDSNGSRSDSGSGVCEIDMYTAFTSLTLDIIGLAAFGNTVSSSGAGMGGGEGDAKETEGKRSVNGGEEEGRSVREVYEAVALLSTGSTKRMFSGRLFIPFYT
ncbi:unnamed protein product [Closterium sp. NIES-64]|nr:unnamed protein product [Closterium sp. NIES-64]